MHHSPPLMTGHADGLENFAVKGRPSETAAEQAARLEAFAKQLEGQS